jgi:outer membrane protein assembly factor BamB
MAPSSGFVIAFLTPVYLLAQQPPTAPPLPPDAWSMFRHDVSRTGTQSATGATAALANPATIKTLHVAWQFPTAALTPGPQQFTASPVVSGGIAYIGGINGVFYAIDTKTGNQKWQFPAATQPPLNGTCSQWGRYGIQASAVIDNIKGEPAVIFGAPDPDPKTDNGNGSARLWALDAITGQLIWKSDVVARLTGCTLGAFPAEAPQVAQILQGSTAKNPEYHEVIKFSSPLLVHQNPPPPGQPSGGAVYIGIASGEDPIQLGAVRSVDLLSGKLDPQYFNSENYSKSASSQSPMIGGGIWEAPTSDGSGSAVYFTTGNTRAWDAASRQQHAPINPGQYPNGYQPPLHYGLSLVRTDLNGAVKWFFQPLPMNLDQDPDWNAGATFMNTSCGKFAVSVMKDGWSYAVNADSGTCFWQFPNMGNPGCRFPSDDKHHHGGNGFRVPGAAWGDVLVIATGGYALPASASADAPALLGRLHALNVCAASASRGDKPSVRWLISPVPDTSVAAPPVNGKAPGDDEVSTPTIINGLIYVGTELGHVMVFADPSVVPAAGTTCDNTNFDASDCVQSGGALVPSPAMLVDVSLPDGGSASRFRKEVVLAEGMVFISTTKGHLYALAP